MGINRDFRKLILANIVNRLGDGIDSIALTWLMYQVTGSASWSAIFFACNQIPSVLVQPLAGALIEERDKKRVMIVADFLRGFFVMVLVLLMRMDRISPLALILFTLLVSTVEAFRIPAGLSLIPRLLSQSRYDRGIGLNSTATTLATLVGTGLSGLIVLKFGYATAMILDTISFFLSGLLIHSIKVPTSKAENRTSKEMKAKAYLDLLVEGFSYALNSKTIRLIIIFSALLNGLLVPINALLAPLISEVFLLDIEFLSFFSISLSLGTLAGSLIYANYGEKIRKGFDFLAFLGLIIGLNYILIYSLSRLDNQTIVKLGLILIPFFIGISIVIAISKLTVILMQEVHEDYLSRIGALFNSISSAIVPLLSFLISSLVIFLRLDLVFLLFGILSILSMLALRTFYEN